MKQGRSLKGEEMATKGSTSNEKNAVGNAAGAIIGHDGNGKSGIPPGESPINKSLLGLLMFVGSEIMFFGGLISSFLILRAGTVTWPPVDQPRMPIAVTGLNTLFLLFSGYTMYRAVKAIRRGNLSVLVKWLYATAVLGAIFLTVQGYEWIGLVSYGLTFTSSVYGGTFYTLIGCHALHVLGAIIFLLLVLRKAVSREYSSHEHTSVALSGVYWYFVVSIWPVLYILVYLN